MATTQCSGEDEAAGEIPPAEILAQLAFAPAERVRPDAEHPGLLRAHMLEDDDLAGIEKASEFRTCRIRDTAAIAGFRSDLREQGFDRVDLSTREALQGRLEAVRRAGRLTAEDARAIRRDLRGARLRLSGGGALRVLYIAPEGFIMRKSGPNGLCVDPSATASEMNDHEAAANVHADQDVNGTPVRQILRGWGPRLFHHRSPDGSNLRSPFFLLNIWIPLDQVTRPLALMDGRSLERRTHQLRFALPTESFLARDEERRVNDIWTFLHDEGQEWYFDSAMDARHAHVFETLSTPHGAFVVPGEEVAEQLYRSLDRAREALAKGDAVALASALSDAEADAPADGRAASPASLRRAVARLRALAREGQAALPEGLGALAASDWSERVRGDLDRLVRKSIEMRVVAYVPRPGRRALAPPRLAG